MRRFCSLQKHDRVKKWDAGEWLFGEIVEQRGETFWVKRDGASGFFTLSFIDIEQSEKL